MATARRNIGAEASAALSRRIIAGMAAKSEENHRLAAAPIVTYGASLWHVA